MDDVRPLEKETSEIVEWCRERLAGGDEFAAAGEISRRLGAHPDKDRTVFGFWIPGVAEGSGAPLLEIFVPTAAIDFRLASQAVRFRRHRFPLRAAGQFCWAVVEGLSAGVNDRSGPYYWVTGAGPGGVTRDCLAYSLPFGSFAPAELYDVAWLQSRRADRGYFQRLARSAKAPGGSAPRIAPPCNILEIHVETATASGTLEALAGEIRAISRKLSTHDPLDPSERLLSKYEAFELLPLEPVAEDRRCPSWLVEEEAPGGDETVGIELRRPEICNWGYDTLIAGFPAVSPTLLAGGRPDELVDLASTLHNFPDGPVKLILDVVFGHAHGQAEDLLDPVFFAGRNRYGLNLNYRHPTVRALLLEMLRRKLNWGADGVRVDASQDILVESPDGKERLHDDEFLDLMGETVVEAASVCYRPFMIYEDGRPWPRPDWKLTASYREVVRRQPEALQWSPLTFASNKPLHPTFWIDKRWRLDEMTRHGSKWITGVSNHDTVRHATHLDTALAAAWPSPRQAFRETYNNPAASLLFIGFLPGVPMDFLNSSREGPWTFMRNGEDHILKTVLGEAGALEWAVDEPGFTAIGNFVRMKEIGFADLARLRSFLWALGRSAQLAGFDLEVTARHLRLIEPPLAGPREAAGLETFCEAWMLDWRDYCRSHGGSPPEATKVDFFHRLRDLRHAHPWLRSDLGGGDRFARLEQHAASVVYHGLRGSPDGRWVVQLLVNLAGEPAPLRDGGLRLDEKADEFLLGTPGLGSAGWPARLASGHGLLLLRRCL